MLYAAQIGISQVFVHHGIGYKYNMVSRFVWIENSRLIASKMQIQPVALGRSVINGSSLAASVPPHIQPSYYAALIAAEAIGSTGKSKLSELYVNASRIAGYGFYEEDVLVRAVLINSLAYLSTNATLRQSTRVKLKFNDTNSLSMMTLKRLIIR